jgi:antirestriction protein ArdC
MMTLSDSKDSKRSDLMQRVTDQLIEALERGTVPWRKPWTGYGPPRNAATGRHYHGVNILLLMLRQLAGEFEYPLWLTLRQANELGGRVRKGERGQLVVFAKRTTREVRNERTGEVEEKSRFVWRPFWVFNVAQLEGVSFAMPEPPARVVAPIEAAEAVWAGYRDAPQVRRVGDRALYLRPPKDEIRMPPRERFESDTAYYQVLFHEGIHSTGAAHRLNRSTLEQAGVFGDQNYSQEELVAEIGSAMLMAHVGLVPDYANSAAYIRGWLAALQNDRRLIVRAAKEAERAVHHIAPKTNQAHVAPGSIKDEGDATLVEGGSAA